MPVRPAIGSSTQDGQPTNRIIETRRRSELITPVPKPQRRRRVAGPGGIGTRPRRRAVDRRAGIQSDPDHQRNSRLRRSLAQPAEPQPMAGDAGDGAAAPALAASSIREPQPVLLPDRGGRDRDLARRGGFRSRGGRRQDLDAHPRRQQGGEPRAIAHRAEARDRCRQDDGHGDADRLADGQRGAPSRQPQLLARLPGHHAGHHDQGSVARAAAERSEQLLPRARTRADRHARRHRARQDRHHQLSRLPPARGAWRCRKLGGRCCKAAARS